MRSHSDNHIEIKAVVVIGLMGILVSFLLIPPVFSSYFAMASLFEQQVHRLWLLSISVFVLSVLLIFFRSELKPAIGLLFFSALILISLELATRLAFHSFSPQYTAVLARLGNRTYPQLLAYKGHPFVQFTGNPSNELIGNKALVNVTPFNNFGFNGRDFRYEKPPNTVRIIALGGSTTASGYPALMEAFLNENNNDESFRYEVMNFAHGWYNSAHLVTNFVLNVLDFSPDYVVIHSG